MPAVYRVDLLQGALAQLCQALDGARAALEQLTQQLLQQETLDGQAVKAALSVAPRSAELPAPAPGEQLAEPQPVVDTVA